jgi:hypothetical protein
MCGLAGLTVIAPSAGAQTVVAAPTAAPAGATPKGAFDGFSVGFTSSVVTGWAADPDAPGQSIEVRLYVDGKFSTRAHTGTARPDVAQALPWAGQSTGWSVDLGFRSVPDERHTVCAYAMNVGPGGNPLLGCRDWRVPDARNPNGSLDGAVVAPGLVRLVGWAGDPDGAPTTRIKILIDLLDSVDAVASLARPDVHAARGLSATTGFDVAVPALPGAHWFCVVVENTGLGTLNPTLPCLYRWVPGVQPAGPHDPVGELDGRGRVYEPLQPHFTYDWSAGGWAYDPDTGGPIDVVLQSIGASLADLPDTGLSLRTLTTGAPRPDVFAAVPAAGGAAGYQGHLATVRGDLHYTCAYAVNVGPGQDRLLGCSSSVVDR